MVDRGHRHQHTRRACCCRRQPDQGAAAAAARHRPALRLAAGAAALADLPERAGARGVRRCCMLALVRRFPDFGVCRARRTDARRGADPADVSGTHAIAWSALCASPGQRLVLGRQPPAALRAVARPDGAVAGARRQCRRLHHGREFQPHVSGLARRAAGGGCLCQRRQRRPGGRDQGVAARAPRGRGDPARRPRRYAIGGRADRGAGPARSRHLSRQLAAAAIG